MEIKIIKNYLIQNIINFCEIITYNNYKKTKNKKKKKEPERKINIEIMIIVLHR